MIYFIQSAGLVKIGTTTCLATRVKTLQSLSAKKVRVLAVMEGSYQTEAGLHAIFERHRRHGEWFLRHREIEYFIRAVRKMPETSCIQTLMNESVRMYMVEKAKRLRHKHDNPKLFNYIERIKARHSSQRK